MGNGCQQRLGVGMTGILKYGIFGSLLGNRPGIHHTDTICSFADNAQIVVMGTVGRKGVKARLIGNTAEKVLAHLKTDVLAIKPR